MAERVPTLRAVRSPGGLSRADSLTRAPSVPSMATVSRSSASQSQTLSAGPRGKTRGRQPRTIAQTRTQAEPRKSSETAIRVLDPDTKEDRTPQSLLRGPHRGTSAHRDRTTRRAGDSMMMSQSTFSASQQLSDTESMSRMWESSDSGSTLHSASHSAIYEGDTVEKAPTDTESVESSSMEASQILGGLSAHHHPQDTAREEVEPEDGWSVTMVAARPAKAEDESRRRLQPCVIPLTETPTFFVFDRPPRRVLAPSEDAEAVQQRNEQIDNFRKTREPTRYTERMVQTLGHAQKNKETQRGRNPAVAAGVSATTWDIYDAMRAAEEDREGPETRERSADEADEDGDEASDNDDEAAFLDDAGDDGEEPDLHHRGKRRHNTWLLAPGLPHALMIVERLVVQNACHRSQLLYRDIGVDIASSSSPRIRPGPPASSEEAGCKLRMLWRYGGPATQGLRVTCLAWNRCNPDLLAAGYSDQSTSPAPPGGELIACWSLKNPAVPERTYRVEGAGVSSLAFSTTHPALLAAGLTDGALALFDVRRPGAAPVLRSVVGAGQHTGTVWQVQWVVKGKDRGEALVSVAADGRVTEWALKKGLEHTTLLRLKRVPNKQPGAGATKGEALLARHSGGLCLDFHPADPMTYLVGTDDCTVHKCSTSYSEQYLETYQGHGAEVYRCLWAPFSSDVFATCSADWTTRVWRQDHPDPMLTIQPASEAVQDLCWSPEVSTVLTTITTGGRVDVWDVRNPLEPAAHHVISGKDLTCVVFAEQNPPVLCIGDATGDITVLRLQGSEFRRPEGEAGGLEAQAAQLLRCLHKGVR